MTNSKKIHFGIIVILVFAGSLVCIAADRFDFQTLRHYEFNSREKVLNDRSVEMVAARFNLDAPSTLKGISIEVDCDKVGAKAEYSIYGGSTGHMLPNLANTPISKGYLESVKLGRDILQIDLEQDLFLNQRQVFLVISNMSHDFRILMDSEDYEATCTNDDGMVYTFQYIKHRKRDWVHNNHAFKFSLNIVQNVSLDSSGFYFRDVTSLVGLPENIAGDNIACYDVNDDEWLDILVGGRLYMNNAGNDFSEVQNFPSGLQHAKAHFFTDIDLDGLVDIIAFYPGVDTLYINSGSLLFNPQPLMSLQIDNPTSVAMSDFNGDSFEDLAVIESDSESTDRQIIVLFNDGNKSYQDPIEVSDVNGITFLNPVSISSVDINNDSKVDLLVSYGGDEMAARAYVNSNQKFIPESVSKYFVNMIDPHGGIPSDVKRQGMDVAVSQPGDLLIASTFSSNNIKAIDHSSASVDAFEHHALVKNSSTSYRVGVPASIYRGGTVLGDIDNDGFMDAILFGGNACSAAQVMMGSRSGTFHDETYESGLWDLTGGNDGVLADFNNDGKIDLVTFFDGMFAIYYNSIVNNNNYIQLDASKDASVATGEIASVHVGGKQYSSLLKSCHGFLMQGPPVFHIGFGKESRIDSISVTGQAGAKQDRTILKPEINSSVELSDAVDDVFKANTIQAEVRPNPFFDKLTVSLTMSKSAYVHVHLYSVNFTKVADIFSGQLSHGKHLLEFNEDDVESSENLATGAYYIIVSDGNSQIQIPVVYNK